MLLLASVAALTPLGAGLHPILPPYGRRYRFRYMNNDDFERIVAEEFQKIPSRFAHRIEKVALLLEEAPSEALRRD